MDEFKVVRFNKTPAVKDAVLIEGLPGIANVSKICVEFLIEKLKAEKILEVYSNSFHNSVIVAEDSTVRLLKIELYHTKVGKKNLFLLSGDSQPAAEKDSYALSQFIIDLMSRNVNEIITLGGIGHSSMVKKPRVHCVVNNKKLIKKLKRLKVVFDGNSTVKLIIGAAGLLLGLGLLKRINCFSLLVETLNHPQYIGVREARKLLEVLVDYLGINISLKELDEEVKEIEDELRKEVKLEKNLKKAFSRDQSYIG